MAGISEGKNRQVCLMWDDLAKQQTISQSIKCFAGFAALQWWLLKGNSSAFQPAAFSLNVATVTR